MLAVAGVRTLGQPVARSPIRLMSAISLLIGAGAHLVTAGLVEGAADAELGFARWALLGTPFGLDRGGRCAPVSLHSRGLGAPCGRLQTAERPRGTALVATVVALWCTEPLHGIGAGLIPVAAALPVIGPLIGSIAARDSIAGIDWGRCSFWPRRCSWTAP